MKPSAVHAEGFFAIPGGLSVAAAMLEACRQPRKDSPVDLNRTPAQIADAAAEELRALNHRTIGTGDDWQYPGDVYSVAGNLSAMAMRLPQVLDQMKVLVDGLAGSGKLHSDRGTLHIDLADTYTGLEEGQQAAALLYEALNRVHQALGPVAYKE